MRWAACGHEKPNTTDTLTTPIAIHTRPEPVKPSHLTLAGPAK